MSSIRIIAITMCAALLTATTALAQPPSRGYGGESAKIAKQRQASVARAKGADAEKQREIQKLEGLIQDLQAGKKVDPAELDRVLHDATR